VYLWRWLGLYSIVVVVAAFVCFRFALRPVIEHWFPELEQARIERARLKQEKRDRKRQKRATK
jgi:molybdopterin biosynthesis enzyme